MKKFESVPIGAYFYAHLNEEYKTSHICFFDFSLQKIKDFVEELGGKIYNEKDELLFEYPTNISFLIQNPHAASVDFLSSKTEHVVINEKQ